MVIRILSILPLGKKDLIVNHKILKLKKKERAKVEENKITKTTSTIALNPHQFTTVKTIK